MGRFLTCLKGVLATPRRSSSTANSFLPTEQVYFCLRLSPIALWMKSQISSTYQATKGESAMTAKIWLHNFLLGQLKQINRICKRSVWGIALKK